MYTYVCVEEEVEENESKGIKVFLTSLPQSLNLPFLLSQFVSFYLYMYIMSVQEEEEEQSESKGKKAFFKPTLEDIREETLSGLKRCMSTVRA